MNHQSMSLAQLLDQIGEADTAEGRASLGAILDAVGRRSFGPLLLVAGLITLAPIIGDIPGVPTIMGLFVLLIAGQLLLRRDHFWLPRWMLERSVRQDRLCNVLKWLRRPARFVDRLLKPRLAVFIQGAGVYVVALGCIAIAAAMPLMEFVPFSANGAGLALTAFGLALIARDGLLALIALIVTVATFGTIAYALF